MPDQAPLLPTVLLPELPVLLTGSSPHDTSFDQSSLTHVSTSMTPMHDMHDNATSVVPNKVPPVPAVFLLEFSVLPTAALLPNESFDHSSLTCASTSMPLTDKSHSNAISVQPA